MKVYLCGGINGLSDKDAKDWRERAKELLVGHESIDPMRRDYRGREGDFAADIVAGDLDDIDGSDVVLAMCPRPSWGTAMEIFYAYGEGIRVFVVCDAPSPSPWLAYHCAAIYPTLDEAVAALLAA